MNITAIYAGTFDPITNGHLDIIRRATPLFRRIVVAIAHSAAKHPFFSLAERIELCKAVLVEEPKIEVIGFDSLLADFAKTQHAQFIIRGLRSVSDFEYESQLARINQRLNPGIESIFFFPTEANQSISSSLVREIASFGGDVSHFVPNLVMQALKNKMG
jgi:pantetheine-phosphate adenylyltransferase